MADNAASLRLTELTCARLCHDLSGLVGTLSGALDLVDGVPDDATEALGLARVAATQLVRRLRLYRAAWGPDGGSMRPDQMLRLAGGIQGAHRISVSADGLTPEAELPPPVARVALNMILLGAESLPRGGEINIAGDPDDLFLRIDGPGAAWPSGMALCLADQDSATSALTTSPALQMPLTALLAHGLGLRLSFLMALSAGGGPPPLRLRAG